MSFRCGNADFLFDGSPSSTFPSVFIMRPCLRDFLRRLAAGNHLILVETGSLDRAGIYRAGIGMPDVATVFQGGSHSGRAT